MQRKKTFWASSRAKISVVWALTLTLIITIYLLIPKENERAIEAAFLVSTLLGKSILQELKSLTRNFALLGSIASTSTLLIRYASPDTFHWSAYLVHGTTFTFSFVMLGLLATDLAFTLRNR